MQTPLAPKPLLSAEALYFALRDWPLRKRREPVFRRKSFRLPAGAAVKKPIACVSQSLHNATDEECCSSASRFVFARLDRIT